MKWSTINAHGWFSYQLKVNKNTENTIKIIASSNTESIDMKVSIDDVEYVIKEKADGKKEFTFTLNTGDTDAVRIRIDRISGNTPCVYQIKVL